MTNKFSRRTFLKRVTVGTLGFVGLSYGGYYYAREFEPRWLNTIYSTIESQRIPKPFNDFKIVQITDTHMGFHYKIEDFEKMIKEVNQESPDLIVFTGDLTDDPSILSDAYFEKIIQIFKQLEAPFGKYWIYGNHDHGGYGTRMIKNVMQRSDFKLLQNDKVKIEKDRTQINLAGLDDVLLGSPRISNLLSDEETNQFNILLCHEPDFARQTINFPFDLQLSGHSHGGQIQLPFVGYIVTPRLGTQYVEGHYELGQRPLHLYVSRGIGTTRLPFRFFCRPEINVYTLQST
ncbi:metallophosphoesterase [Filobacillus milosensis]|uniref:Metallophosphoesterase n=1 Tax=Filobacillus milosensis TaxID=94137 RepID=A0A4Y8IDJ7_9BACI|nr:metallophosphoesterase [Filobacillus milosensis]TFB14058.1 metallophosphoesterase [Filobacillus milosensis]